MGVDFPKLYKSTIMNYQLFSFVFYAVVAAISFFDFFVYAVKKAPKSAVLSFRFWIVGMLCGILAIYYILNGQKFF